MRLHGNSALRSTGLRGPTTRARSTASCGGVWLVLLTDERGLPLGYTIVPANDKEYEPLADLLTGTQPRS
jgi:hypothetical protein